MKLREQVIVLPERINRDGKHFQGIVMVHSVWNLAYPTGLHRSHVGGAMAYENGQA
jgi:hypothetical protein